MAKKRVKKPAVVPPKGAPSNLRPAGAHKDPGERPRSRQLREALEDQELREPPADLRIDGGDG